MKVLIVRLGALGDVLHTLPAVTAMKRAHPDWELHWVIEPRWMPLLEGNPDLASLIPLNRRSWRSIWDARAHLRSIGFDQAYDFQGLLKSALTAWQSGARRIVGYDQTRESLATWFYSEKRHIEAQHVADRHAALAEVTATPEVWMPPGKEEGQLPEGPFVLGFPFGGWAAKQWPLDYFVDLARMLPVPLVLNVARADRQHCNGLPGVQIHSSTIPGLIGAVRRAAAVIGIDSGPLHLAAALRRPGVAVFGPTDPARNGPYGDTIRVLRSEQAPTSYARGTQIIPAMRDIRPKEVYAVLAPLLVS